MSGVYVANAEALREGYGAGLQMRQIVRKLAQLFPTAIVSGRGREKVMAFVKLKELYYAGSHGMDIAGPQVGHVLRTDAMEGLGWCWTG